MMRKVGNTPFSGSFYHLYRHQHNNQFDESDPLPIRNVAKNGENYILQLFDRAIGREREREQQPIR